MKLNESKWIVYKTTCIINNKIYIGVHKTKNVNDSYIGCGVYRQSDTKILEKRKDKLLFVRAVKKHGYKNFKKEILFIFNNREDAFEQEARLVDADFVKRKDTYNTKLGGNKGPDCTGYANNNSAKEYVLWKTNGEVVNIFNLSQYCKQNSLCYSLLKERANKLKKYIIDDYVIFHKYHFEQVQHDIKNHVFYLPKSKKIKKKKLITHKDIVLISPEGEEVYIGKIYNNDILKKIGVSYGHVRGLCNKKYAHVKGYTLSYEKHYEIITYFIKDNIIYKVFNVKEFCRNNKLNYQGMFDVKNKKRECYKGYRIWQKY